MGLRDRIKLEMQEMESLLKKYNCPTHLRNGMVKKRPKKKGHHEGHSEKFENKNLQ